MKLPPIKERFSKVLYLVLCVSLVLTCHIYCIFIKIFLLLDLLNQKQIDHIKDKIKKICENMIEIPNYINEKIILT